MDTVKGKREQDEKGESEKGSVRGDRYIHVDR